MYRLEYRKLNSCAIAFVYSSVRTYGQMCCADIHTKIGLLVLSALVQ